MKNIILGMLKELGADVCYNDFEDTISVDFNDFAGFDENYSEIDREYTNPQLVNAMISFLETRCDYIEGDLYTTYHFIDFTVVVGYTSYDI